MCPIYVRWRVRKNGTEIRLLVIAEVQYNITQ